MDTINEASTTLAKPKGLYWCKIIVNVTNFFNIRLLSIILQIFLSHRCNQGHSRLDSPLPLPPSNSPLYLHKHLN